MTDKNEYQEYKELITKVEPLVIRFMQQNPMDVLEYTASMNPKEAFVLGMIMNRVLNIEFGL